jgi:hypothetical protein
MICLACLTSLCKRHSLVNGSPFPSMNIGAVNPKVLPLIAWNRSEEVEGEGSWNPPAHACQGPHLQFILEFANCRKPDVPLSKVPNDGAQMHRNDLRAPHSQTTHVQPAYSPRCMSLTSAQDANKHINAHEISRLPRAKTSKHSLPNPRTLYACLPQLTH